VAFATGAAPAAEAVAVGAVVALPLEQACNKTTAKTAALPPMVAFLMRARRDTYEIKAHLQ
jgi:hypothetical protein